MKRVLAVVFLAVLALVPACGDDDEASLVGAWVQTDTDGGRTEMVMTSTTYESYSYDAQNVKTDGEKGTYTFSGGKITIKVTHDLNSEGQWVVATDATSYTFVCVVSGSIMTITTPDGTSIWTKK